jgi:hypothetical protein
MKGTPFLPGYEYCNNNNQSKNTHFNQELDEEFWEKYQLKWSNGNNSLEVFQTIVNNETNYDSIVRWVKDTCSHIPRYYANILIYCTLTGLRADEACKSVFSQE